MTLTEDVLKSSEIEGEKLNEELVRSSIARRLDLDIGGLQAIDRNVEGVVEMMLDATRRVPRASDCGTALRMACVALPNRPKRNEEDQDRQLARRC